MEVEDQVRALRLGVAFSELAHVAALRITGDDALDTLDAICPADLFIRDGQMIHSLLLDVDGHPVADCYLCRDDEDVILLAEGLSPPALAEYLAEHTPPGLAPRVVDLGATHELWEVGGPYAWELMAELVGPGVVGLPYLNFFHEDGWTCFRAGKTGEFGYDLLVPREKAPALRAKLAEAGRPMGLVDAGLDALDVCALENWFFNVRREGREKVTPLELQLQWRLSSRKDYVGAAAVRERRRQGIGQRLTCALAPSALARGDDVFLDELKIGRLLNVAYSPMRGDWVAMALIDRPYAYPDTDRYTARCGEERVRLRTVCPPVLHNRSLFIHLQRDSFWTREEREYPPPC